MHFVNKGSDLFREFFIEFKKRPIVLCREFEIFGIPAEFNGRQHGKGWARNVLLALALYNGLQVKCSLRMTYLHTGVCHGERGSARQSIPTTIQELQRFASTCMAVDTQSFYNQNKAREFFRNSRMRTFSCANISCYHHTVWRSIQPLCLCGAGLKGFLDFLPNNWPWAVESIICTSAFANAKRRSSTREVQAFLRTFHLIYIETVSPVFNDEKM